MHILVTGGTGFLGGRLIPQLTRDSHQVFALTRSSASHAKLRALGASPADAESGLARNEGNLAFPPNHAGLPLPCQPLPSVLEMTMITHDTHLHIGSLLFEGIDQIDLTGPFEVLSRIPNATYRIYGKTAAPVRDLKGLRLAPDAALADAPQLDVLHVPGGYGQEALMEDAEVLGWIRQQASGACRIFSVCTGALICGAAGLLKGRRATTHWNRFICCRSSVRSPSTNGWWSMAPGSLLRALQPASTAPCALRLAAELRGDEAAQAIQLQMVYAPEPPFDSGTPATAPSAILDEARRSVRPITAQREQTARRVAAKLGIAVLAAGGE
jgi:cyclohexyl-isocyanide hydratase